MKLLNPFKTFTFLPKLQFFISKTAAVQLKGHWSPEAAQTEPTGLASTVDPADLRPELLQKA